MIEKNSTFNSEKCTPHQATLGGKGLRKHVCLCIKPPRTLSISNFEHMHVSHFILWYLIRVCSSARAWAVFPFYWTSNNFWSMDGLIFSNSVQNTHPHRTCMLPSGAMFHYLQRFHCTNGVCFWLMKFRHEFEQNWKQIKNFCPIDIRAYWTYS